MRKRRDSLSSIVAKGIAERIESGEFSVGDKLPIEAQLGETYNVSRTVVREAIAHLRSEGLVESRQGVGVFVSGQNGVLKISPEKAGELAEILEILELRLGVEVEAAGLAAQRRSDENLAKIMEIIETTADLDRFIENPRELDFSFHMAIAEATGNGYMPRFLSFIGPVIIPRSQLIHASVPELTRDYLAKMNDEHRRIADAIARKDVLDAREAMRFHLVGSLERYRKLKDA
ncbi:MAG TPA: FadR/GntR family transcriptional regulator [Paracoccus sp. (in: a-proteobacteria)]|uniref:FadR/GntR family transcriptional regulator n=1 Tax=Paracoccus sp. TaxID=267 RepID=UPI002BDD4542|nr:FadR/GntR family transcriptional regulator [Paracoccus sp. (in: a-proteobacteria)]HWL57610.1 FadR/GntR family transcriptional regulator [Paracoccus sp. (in: a-proteobacteria)]